MSDMTTADAAWSYRTGAWFAVFGPRVTVLLPESERERVVDLWAVVDGGGDFDEVLDRLLASGLSRLPGFVLVGIDEGPARVLLRGTGVTAVLVAGDDETTLDGGASATWVERTVDGLTSLRVEIAAEGADVDATDYPILGGLVRVGRVDHPAVEAPATAAAAAAVAPEPTPEIDVDDLPVVAPVAAADAADTDTDADDAPDTLAEPEVEPASAEADGDADADAGEVDLDAEAESAVDAIEAAVKAAIQADPEATQMVDPAELLADDAAAEPADTESPDTEADDAADVEAAEEPAVAALDLGKPAGEPSPLDPAADEPAAAEAPEPTGDPLTDPMPDPMSEPASETPGDWVTPWDKKPAEPAAAAPAPGLPSWDAPPSWGAPASDAPLTEVAPQGAVPPAAPAAPPAPPEAPDDFPPPLPVGSWEPVGGFPPPPPPPADHDGLTSVGAPGGYPPPPAPGAPAAPGAVARLMISDGQTIDVDRVILIGRAPEARRFTATEAPSLVTVPSRLHEISSTHVEVRPGTGADHGTAVVTDMGSTNGTVLVQPGLQPEDLKPGVAVALVPGAMINLGDGITIQVTRP